MENDPETVATIKSNSFAQAEREYEEVAGVCWERFWKTRFGRYLWFEAHRVGLLLIIIGTFTTWYNLNRFFIKVNVLGKIWIDDSSTATVVHCICQFFALAIMIWVLNADWFQTLKQGIETKSAFLDKEYEDLGRPRFPLRRRY